MWGINLLKGLGVTLKYMFKPKVTIEYPEVKIVHPERFRGIQHIDRDLCIVCNQCVRICPTQAISLTGKPNPDPEKKVKVLDTYDIKFGQCILCDLCTEVCPTDAIQMTNTYEHAVYYKENLVKDIDWLEENTEQIRGANQ